MSGGALRQIFALFDVDTGDASTKIKSLNKDVSGVKDALGALAISALGAFSFDVIKSFMTEQIDAAKEIRLTAAKLGVGTEELEAWNFAAGAMGVSAEGAANGLKFLNKNMGLALEGNKEAVESFSKLDVQLKDQSGNVREIGDVLPEIADSFEKMGSQQERTTAAMKLFGRAGADLLPLLQGGSKNINELRERFNELGGGMDEDFIAKAKEAGREISAVKFGINRFKISIAAELLPYVIEFGKKIAAVSGFLVKLSKETNIAKEVVGALGILAAITAGKMIYSWTKVLGLFPKGGNLIGNLFKMGEIGLIIAAVVILGLAIEDIVTMCQGGQSVIGDFLDEMLGVEYRTQLVESLNQAWNDMAPAISDLKPLIKDFGVLFAEVLPYAIALVVDLLKAVMSVATEIMGLGEYVATVVTKGFKAGDEVAARVGDQQSNIWKTGSTTMSLINAPASVPQPSGSGQQGSPVELNANNYISIIGATDPDETGKRVMQFQRGTNEQMVKDAANALATGTP